MADYGLWLGVAKTNFLSNPLMPPEGKHFVPRPYGFHKVWSSTAGSFAWETVLVLQDLDNSHGAHVRMNGSLAEPC